MRLTLINWTWIVLDVLIAVSHSSHRMMTCRINSWTSLAGFQCQTAVGLQYNGTPGSQGLFCGLVFLYSLCCFKAAFFQGVLAKEKDLSLPGGMS